MSPEKSGWRSGIKNAAAGLATLGAITVIFYSVRESASGRRIPGIDLLKIDPAPVTGGQLLEEYSILTPSADSLPSIFRDRQAVADYLAAYLPKHDRELSVVMTPNLVQMKVIDPMGIILRDFPDKRRGREIPTNGSGTGPSIKALYWGQNIPGLFMLFIFEKDPQTRQLLNIWAVRFSNEGGWPIHKQPHPEFFRVGGLELEGWKWYTVFDTENGSISGEGYFGITFPQLSAA